MNHHQQFDDSIHNIRIPWWMPQYHHPWWRRWLCQVVNFFLFMWRVEVERLCKRGQGEKSDDETDKTLHA